MGKGRWRWPVVALLLLQVAWGPAAAQTLTGEAVEVQLVFGLSGADGNGVSEQEWDNWLTDVLSRNVPGFTVSDCRGGWRQGERLEREDCKLVLVVTDRAGLPALAAAVDAFKTRFRQESVLWVERPCGGGCGFR